MNLLPIASLIQPRPQGLLGIEGRLVAGCICLELFGTACRSVRKFQVANNLAQRPAMG
jgi:hypothetical protein